MDSRSWPEVSGLFVFAAPDSSEQGWKPLFVGQARSFAATLPIHPNWPVAELQHGATHIHLLRVDSEWERARLEKHLIEQLQPELNLGA